MMHVVKILSLWPYYRWQCISQRQEQWDVECTDMRAMGEVEVVRWIYSRPIVFIGYLLFKEYRKLRKNQLNNHGITNQDCEIYLCFFTLVLITFSFCISSTICIYKIESPVWKKEKYYLYHNLRQQSIIDLKNMFPI